MLSNSEIKTFEGVLTAAKARKWTKISTLESVLRIGYSQVHRVVEAKRAGRSCARYRSKLLA